MLNIQDSPMVCHCPGDHPASKRAWKVLSLWMAGLALALLTACGGGGGGGTASSAPPAGPSAAPGAPSGVVVTAGNGQATITWDSVAGATSYNIYRSTTQGQPGKKVGASAATSFVDTTAVNNTTYYYQVTADNAAGEGPTSTQSPGTTPSVPVTAPPAPSGVTATPGNAQVTVGWTAVIGADSYNVYRSTSAGTKGSKVGTSLTTSYIDTSAVNGSTYFYAVTADNTAGEGPASAPSSGATPAVPVAAPAAPTGVTATAGNGQATVSWTAVASATSYNVYRSTSQGAQGPKVGSSSTTSYLDSTTANGATYYYVVTAANAAGEGPASAQSTGATPAVPLTAPAAPTGANAVAGNALVTVTWTSSPNSTSYNVYRSTSPGSQGTKVGSSASTSYADVTAINGTTYYYQVTAANSAGESPASAQTSPATPAVPLTVPATPAGVNAAAGNALVTVTWNAAARATSYNVYRSTTSGSQGTKVGSSASTSYADATAINGTTYYYQVTAVNAAGEGLASTQSASATPAIPLPAAPAAVSLTDGIAQVTVNWASVATATSYKVYRSTSAGSRGTVIASGSALSHADNTAINGTTYYYVVTAVNATGEGPGSTAASVTPATTWKAVKMGGGGYITGILYHPTVQNLRYARTDVGGAYRWDNGMAYWTSLSEGFSRLESSSMGVESLAVDPTDPNKVYMVTGMSISSLDGRFHYSSNQGTTWSSVALPFPVAANNAGRAIGERLRVDPNLPSTMFYASRTAGLWKSTNSGLNWSQVTSLSSYVMSSTDVTNANGGSPVGAEFAVFDVTVPTTGFVASRSATSTIYVGVAPDYKALAGLSSYLYRSSDGGATWSGITIPANVTSTITGGPYIPHLARAADGVLYVPFTSTSGPGSANPSMLYKFDGTNWTQLIVSGGGLYWGGIGGLGVHGSGATTKIVFGVSNTWGDAGYVQVAMASSDAGTTWREIGRSGDTGGSLNYHDMTSYWGWPDDLQIDPFNPNHVTYGTGGGIFTTTDAFSTTLPHWKFDVEGIEEQADLEMTAPPPGASYVLASGQGDTGLWVHTSLTTSPTRPSNLKGGGNGSGIDMAWNNPAFIVGVGAWGGTSKGTYSTDSGLTWTTFPSVPPTATATADSSKVAVTADGANIIWSVAGQVPYYSTNRGTTWVATNLPAPPATWLAAYHIVADRKNPLKVYAFDHGGNFWYGANTARFYRSTDGGHTFTAVSQTWNPNGNDVTSLRVNPFVEGDVWLTDANNLWHSVDSGATWTKLTAMATVGAEPTRAHGAMKVALGAPAPNASYSAAVYLIGTINAKDGVYRSDDAGVTWLRIDDDAHRHGGVSRIAADASIFGRVFLAGRGMDYNN